MSTLSTNQIVVEYIIREGDVKKAKDEFDKLSQAEKDAIANAKKLADELEKTGKEGKKATDKVSGGMNNIGGSAIKLGPLLAGAFSIAAVVSFGKQVFNVTAEFQKLSAVLKNTLGSGAAASMALDNIKEFAKTTPFAVSELTASFVKLANQGFTPTIDQMRKLGDLASSTGKSFDQLAEAIIDAQVGEFERLKEFGVRAQKAGDQVIFTFKGVETQVKNNNAAIREYLVGLGDYTGVAGSAAAVSDTLGGKVNNLGDAWDGFLNKIGTLLGPVLTEALNTTSQFMDGINKIFGGARSDSERFAAGELETYKVYQDELLTYTDDQLSEFIERRQARIKEIQDAISVQRKKVEEGSSGIFGNVKTGGVVEAEKQILSLSETLAGLTGSMAAAEDQIKLRSEGALQTANQLLDIEKQKKAQAEAEAKALAKKQAELQKEYSKRLELLNILTEIRKLEQDSPEGQLAAEKSLYEAKLKLQLDFINQGLKFKKEDIDLTKAQGEKAAKDLEQLEKAALMDRYKATTTTEADIEKARKESMDKTVKDNKDMMDELDRQRDEQLKKEEKRIQLKKQVDQELTKQTYDLAVNSANALFDLQSQYDQNAFKQKMKGYDEELRLAGDNVQKQTEIEEKRAQAEKEYQKKQFRANQLQAVANVVFNTAPIVAKYAAAAVTIPLAIAAAATAAAQIGFILAQPVPEFAEGTKGKPFKGGKAIVGEIGKEWVVTTSGQVYETPGVATLVDLPKGSQVIPNKDVIKAERFMGSKMMNQSRGDSGNGQLVERLISIENTLSKLPITSLTMDERGFTKKIQTKSRETTILNNRFSS